MTICYLDPEDEITGAVARIRAVEDGAAVVVLPPGSRIATSRINFRLLAREAEDKGLNLVAVSDEPGVRALAISAGVPAYDSVAGAETGLRELGRQDRRLAERVSAPAQVAPPPSGRHGHGSAAPSTTESPRPTTADERLGDRSLDATRVMVAPSAPPARAAEGAPTRAPAPPAAPPARRPATPPRTRDSERDRRRPAVGMPTVDDGEAAPEPYQQPRPRRRGSAVGPLLAIGLIFALVAVAAYGAFFLLPTATITLRPHLTPVGPVSGTVIADPQVAIVDPGEGTIPAQQLQLPLSAGGEFNATGTRVATTRATGVVRFESHNTVSEVAVPAGTRVATANGVAFEITEAVTVPRADFATGTPGEVETPVRAVRAGLRGNVDAGAITVAPQELADQLLFVNNPQPTSGGERRETRIVAQEDYDAAVAELTEQLSARLAAALADPATTPRGLTLYPASAVLGRPTPDQPAAELVGNATERFSLALSTTASALAVNESLIEPVALEQLGALVPPGGTLFGSGVDVSHTPGEVREGTVVYTVSAAGSAYRLFDRDQLVDEVSGLPVAEARAIMERHGSAELSVWPEFVDRVPDQAARINLTILPPTESP